jgi:hypothetical protein
LKAKYYPNSSFWTASNTGPRSVFWASVLQIKPILQENSIIQIHAGNSSIWSTPWMPSWSSIHDHILLPITNSPLPATVADLWLQDTRTWNQDLLSTTFSQEVVQIITNTPIIHSPDPDILRWKPSPNGQCSSKSSYKLLQLHQIHSLPPTGSRALSPHSHSILQKIWKIKTMPPLLKTFAWRLFRQALPTADRVSRFVSHINRHCTSCGLIENDSHLFFLCTVPHQVWNHAPLPPVAHLIDPQADGIQQILPHILPLTITDHNLIYTLLILWYIWKARNDHRFQRKVWSFMQVLHAAHSHFTTNSQAWHNDVHNTIAPLLLISTPNYHGYRCYVDAATFPDSHNDSHKPAGLGIFIVNTDINPPFAIFIKAFL